MDVIDSFAMTVFIDGHRFPDLVGMNVACNKFVQSDLIKSGEMNQCIQIRLPKCLLVVRVCLSGNIQKSTYVLLGIVVFFAKCF